MNIIRYCKWLPMRPRLQRQKFAIKEVATVVKYGLRFGRRHPLMSTTASERQWPSHQCMRDRAYSQAGEM